MTEPAVRLVGIEKRFGNYVVLHGIDLDVAPNEFVSLLGPSGCGKTTLLQIIAGFERASSGRVAVAGMDVTEMPPHQRPTNLVFQRGALFPHMTVAENIGYSLKLRGWPKARIDARVEELLALVRMDGLGGRGPPSCPAARSSAPRWLGRSPPNPPCCCSMSPSPRWT
ncbi:MAG: ABC transporter ATP-binding protein [Chloroflexota bacterium]